jgi:hypothetical protein
MVTPGSPSITTAQSLTVTISVSGSKGTPTGTVTLSSGSYASAATALVSGSATISIPAGKLATGTDMLSAAYTPDAASSSTYTSATGTGSVTVAAPALITPTVTVMPGSSSITTAQSLTVTVTVSGGSGNPTPTGSVTLTSGSYASAATALVSGSATISIPAGKLAAGTDMLSAAYTPDAASSSVYTSATGTGSVTVAAPALITPTVTVMPGSSSISSTQILAVTVTVSGGSGNPTPTGSVTLTSGSYASAATALVSGSATISIPAGKLAAGTDTLSAAYTPDTAGSATYTSATGTGSVTVTAPETYVLTVDSAAPASGISIAASPADNNSKNSGTTPFTLTYNSGTQVTLTAALTVAGSTSSYSFVSWSGCTSTSGSSGSICMVTVNGNTTVTASYNQTGVTSITITPDSATVGTQQEFTATVNGAGSYSKSVTWTLSCPACGSLSEGDFASTTSTTALYNTPYPAPASVVITATSTQDTAKSASVTVALNPPSTTAGPALSVDVNTPNEPSENPHTISPYVYGVNGYLLDAASEAIINPGVVRWGGDDTSRYNYQNGWSNSASDYYFLNGDGAAAMFPNSTSSTNFTQFFPSVDAAGAAALGTVPVLGWVSNGDSGACSFTASAYPGQESYDQYESSCGDGIYPDGTGGCTSSGGCDIYGNNTIAAITSNPEPPPCTSPTSTDTNCTQAPSPGSVTASWADGTWSGGWVNSIVSNYGNGASGKGVAIWDLDNEPTWWSAVHRDVHPDPFTYDEVTNNDIGTALAIKTADPTALVSGPVIDYWWAYFYSMKDIWSGWASGPCYQPWSNPTDREAHGGVPLIEYYLQQFNNDSQAYGVRLLDYLDIHGYFAPDYPAGSGNSVAFTTAGDTQEQEARMNGTRVFWDPTYTDPNYPQPNYITDSNYTASCSPPAQAPELIPMLQAWVNGTAPLGNPNYDYPGTKTSIDEYNFGALDSINGAVVEADILGIFGRQGLDMSALWPSGAYNTEAPGNYAFAMYRNYDGKDSTFGSQYLQAVSTISGGGDGEGQLAVYGAQRSSDGALTVMVINKTFGPLTSTLSLLNFTAPSGTTAQVYQYSNANLNAIEPQPAVSVTPPSGSGTTSTISNYTFPAQSITLFVVPD